MAHICPTCGVRCHCGSDVDDITWEFNDFCIHCVEDDEEDEFYEENDEPNMNLFCEHCGGEYDEIDYEYQMCHRCYKESIEDDDLDNWDLIENSF